MTNKNLLRTRILTLRNQLDDSLKNRAGRLICEKLMNSSIFHNANTVMSYMDFRNEVPVQILNRTCLSNRKNLLLPYCTDKEHMVAVRADVLPDGTETDLFGINVPKEALNKVIQPSDIDMVVVPGVVFNPQCYRIGYGKGFYDRFLTSVGSSCIKIGFSYEFQIVDQPFQAGYDVPMDLIISEERVYYHEHCTIRL